jgi:hypothetical protein
LRTDYQSIEEANTINSNSPINTQNTDIIVEKFVENSSMKTKNPFHFN